jgi:hypothetical protein
MRDKLINSQGILRIYLGIENESYIISLFFSEPTLRLTSEYIVSVIIVIGRFKVERELRKVLYMSRLNTTA